MKSKTVKFICISLSAIIVILSGCDSNSVKNENATTTTTANVTTTTTTTTSTKMTFQKIYTTQKTTFQKNQISKNISVHDLGLVDKNLYTYGNINKQLANQLKSILKNYDNNISIACWSTDGSRAVLYNTQQTYFSACTIKMPVMYAYCKQMDDGVIDPNEKLTYQKRHWHQGSGEIRYHAYGNQYTTQELVEKSLSISDNVAYKMLLERYGKEPLKQLAKQLDCESIVFSDGSKWAKNINARDLMVVWSDIYDYFCSDSTNAKMLKNACTNTKFNYGTKRLTEYDYSHKSGDNFGEFRAYHDAGIVWSDVPYVYVVLTHSEGTSYDSDTVDPAMEIINKIMTTKM